MWVSLALGGTALLVCLATSCLVEIRIQRRKQRRRFVLRSIALLLREEAEAEYSFPESSEGSPEEEGVINT